MSFFVRFSFAALIAAACVFASLPAFSQTIDTTSGSNPAAAQPADPAKDSQRQVADIAAAARSATAPADTPRSGQPAPR